MHRNLRQRPQISYCEVEEPDLDEYVFCDECRDYVYEYCAIHGPLLVLPDNKVPPPTGFPDFVPHAALTIPHEFLHLAPSNIPGAGIGVFATLTLPKGVRFGPYRGVRTKDMDSEYCWQIYSSSSGGRKPLCAVDARDARRSNWMRYVNCSRHCAEQNLLAYQYQGELYYRTVRIVPRFSELLVFYGAEFARSLRVDLRLYNRVEGLQQLIGAPKLMHDDTEKQSVTDDNPPNTEFADSKSTANVNKVPLHETCTETSHINEINERNELKNISNLSESSKIDIQNAAKAKTKAVISKLNAMEGNNNMVLFKSKAHSCNICNYKTYRTNVLQSHLKAHSASTRFICDICDFIAIQRYGIIKHLKTHTGEKPYACDICDKRFTNRHHLDVHIRIHTGEKPYACDICNKKFSKNSDLTRHIRTHSGEKPYFCDICDKRFTDKRNLNTHIRIHTGEKPYACDICNKKFSENSDLTRHIRTHSGEKPYFCDICDKRFTAKPSLNMHIRIHTGEKPYACDICDKKFSKNSNLTRHIRTHSGEKP